MAALPGELSYAWSERLRVGGCLYQSLRLPMAEAGKEEQPAGLQAVSAPKNTLWARLVWGSRRLDAGKL